MRSHREWGSGGHGLECRTQTRHDLAPRDSLSLSSSVATVGALAGRSQAVEVVWSRAGDADQALALDRCSRLPALKAESRSGGSATT